jgi:hypothetical protein
MQFAAQWNSSAFAASSFTFGMCEMRFSLCLVRGRGCVASVSACGARRGQPWLRVAWSGCPSREVHETREGKALRLGGQLGRRDKAVERSLVSKGGPVSKAYDTR